MLSETAELKPRKLRSHMLHIQLLLIVDQCYLLIAPLILFLIPLSYASFNDCFQLLFFFLFDVKAGLCEYETAVHLCKKNVLYNQWQYSV